MKVVVVLVVSVSSGSVFIGQKYLQFKPICQHTCSWKVPTTRRQDSSGDILDLLKIAGVLLCFIMNNKCCQYG